MAPTPRVRKMTGSDLPFADALRAIAGWNQTLDDWRRLLALTPDGCFVVECGGVPAGTVTTIRHGPDLRIGRGPLLGRG